MVDRLPRRQGGGYRASRNRQQLQLQRPPHRISSLFQQRSRAEEPYRYSCDIARHHKIQLELFRRRHTLVDRLDLYHLPLRQSMSEG